MSDKPDPPYGADVDLKDFPFTPIYRARLFGSSFHARANDAEWRAGVTLWLKSQDQMPGGSLPTDDVDLCRLAELGRDMRTWKKLKTGALHGWYECNDGRLYHPVVAEIVEEQWTGKLRQKWRTDCARAKKYCQRHSLKFDPPDFDEWMSQGQKCNVPGTGEKCPGEDDPVSQGQWRNVPGENHSKGQGEGQGQGQGDSDSEVPDGPSGAAAPPEPEPERDPVKEIFDRGVVQLGKSSRSVIARARKEYGNIAVLAAIIACEGESPSEPVAFFIKCLETRNQRGNGKQSPVAKLYEGALLAAEEWERRQGSGGDNFPPDVPLLDRGRPH